MSTPDRYRAMSNRELDAAFMSKDTSLEGRMLIMAEMQRRDLKRQLHENFTPRWGLLQLLGQ